MSLNLGVQVSIAGKIYHSIDRAKVLGCTAMQIFARNPRQWRRAALSQEDIVIFRQKLNQAKIAPVAIHIPYTLNLAATKQSFYKITIEELNSIPPQFQMDPSIDATKTVLSEIKKILNDYWRCLS